MANIPDPPGISQRRIENAGQISLTLCSRVISGRSTEIAPIGKPEYSTPEHREKKLQGEELSLDGQQDYSERLEDTHSPNRPFLHSQKIDKKENIQKRKYEQKGAEHAEYQTAFGTQIHQ